MVKIKVAKDEIDNIKRKIKEKGWNIDRNTTQVIPKANQCKLESFFKEQNITYKKYIKIDDLRKLVKAKIITDKSENDLRDYIEEQEKSKVTEIPYGDFCNYFFNENSKEVIAKMRFKQITERTYKYFIEDAQEIDKEIFQIFCKVIGVNWRKVVDKDSIYYKSYSLLNSLVSFDHHKQVNLLKIKFNDNKPFLISNYCIYSRIWLLRRLETEITRITARKCRRINITGSQYIPLNNHSIQSKFSSNNLNLLSNENILIFCDLEFSYCSGIEMVISDYWNNLNKQIAQNNPGKLIMFLLNTNNDQELTQKLNAIKVNNTDLFALDNFQDDLAALLSELSIRHNMMVSSDFIGLSQQMIKESKNDTGKLLTQIFNQFLEQKQVQNELDSWKNYP
jgi:hypothetical protein